eukprot:SAG11_NODE_47275_length_130_cov_84.709677_1_plen_21_part_10
MRTNTNEETVLDGGKMRKKTS